MKFREAEKGDFGEIRQLLASNGWAKRVADDESYRKMMENASRTIVAVEGKRIVGFARALCDDASNGYIGTLIVAEDKRGQGIGRSIVEKLLGDNPDITWVLRAGRESGQFWEKMGFQLSTVAMERPRR